MKRVMSTICLIAILLIAGCHGVSLLDSPNTQAPCSIPFMFPGWYLVGECIEDLDALMVAEWKADAEFENVKNPVYFMEENK